MSIADDVLETLKPQALRGGAQAGAGRRPVLCARGAIPFSKLIQWSTKSPWSHIAIAFRIEGAGPGDRDRERGEDRGAGGGALRVLLAGFGGNLALSRQDRAGAPCGVRGHDQESSRWPSSPSTIWGAASPPARSLRSAFASPRPSSWASTTRCLKMLIPDDEFICSEFVAAAFQAAKVTIPWDGLGFIAPSDFANAPKVEALAQVDVSKPPKPPKPKKKS